uniref:Translocon-associated protein subunit beta n=1 Tax=Schistosoma haematobium TaxID=6185 RepID=A0A094ZU03_SCHHA
MFTTEITLASQSLRRSISLVTQYPSTSRAAKDVELFDISAETEFTLIHGSPSARWAVIPASSNVTHVLILKPQINGVHNFSSATITYKSGDLQKSSFLISSHKNE